MLIFAIMIIFVFIIIVQFMMSANIRIRFGLQIVLVCTEHHLIIIIVQTYLKALNILNACQIYFVECVTKIKHILFVFHSLYNMWGCMFSVYPFPLWWLGEYIYFILLSSANRKYELLPIV